MKTIQLEIVTPDGITFSGEVETVVLPGLEGLFGVLPGHAPFMSVLGSGEAKYVQGGKTHYLAVSGGFAQVDPHKVTVLAENAELAAAIDAIRATEAAKAKGDTLKGPARLQPDQYAKIQASLLKELVRVKVAGRHKEQGQ